MLRGVVRENPSRQPVHRSINEIHQHALVAVSCAGQFIPSAIEYANPRRLDVDSLVRKFQRQILRGRGNFPDVPPSYEGLDDIAPQNADAEREPDERQPPLPVFQISGKKRDRAKQPHPTHSDDEPSHAPPHAGHGGLLGFERLNQILVCAGEADSIRQAKIPMSSAALRSRG